MTLQARTIKYCQEIPHHLKPTLARSEKEEAKTSSSTNGAESVCYIRPQQSAKSFSYAQIKSQQVERAEQQLQRQISSKPAHPQIKYESVSQFSQKVELYRGR
jgi:hypothetical protein